MKPDDATQVKDNEPDKEATELHNSDVDADVMDRICHDLDYLLGGGHSPAREPSIPNILIQNTSL